MVDCTEVPFRSTETIMGSPHESRTVLLDLTYGLNPTTLDVRRSSARAMQRVLKAQGHSASKHEQHGILAAHQLKPRGDNG